MRGKGIIEKLFLSDVVSKRTIISAHLFSRSNVFAADCGWGNWLCHLHGSVLLVLEDGVHLAFGKIAHRQILWVFGGDAEPLTGKLDLVQKSKRSAALLLHNLVDEFAIKFDFQFAKCILDEVEVVDFRLFVFPNVTV